MTAKQILDILSIGTGAILMLLAIRRAWGIRHAVQQVGICRQLKLLLILMKFFFLGYLLSILAILTRHSEWLHSVVSLVFLFGSVFVLLTIQIAHQTTARLEAHNQQLEQAVREKTSHLVAAIKEKEAERLRFTRLFQELPIACFTYDREGRIHDWNIEAMRTFGFSAEEAIGKTVCELFCHPDEAERTRAAIADVFAGHSLYNVEWQDISKDGTVRWILCSTFPLVDASGQVTQAISANVDITALKEQQQLIEAQRDELEAQGEALQQLTARLAEANASLEQLAACDALTGLPNHRVFRERLYREFLWSLEHDDPLSVIMIDVDHFKQFNDSFGHQAGDDVLRRVASVLQENTTEGGLAARYGGEEFVMLLPGYDELSATRFAEHIRQAIADMPCQYRQITASLGVSTLSLHTLNPDTLIEEADQALYLSKRHGRNRVTHAAAEQLLIDNIPPDVWRQRVEEAASDPTGYAFRRVVSQIVFDHLQLLRRLRAKARGEAVTVTDEDTTCRYELWMHSVPSPAPIDRVWGAEHVDVQQAQLLHNDLCRALRSALQEPSAEQVAQVAQAVRLFTEALQEVLARHKLAA